MNPPDLLLAFVEKPEDWFSMNTHIIARHFKYDLDQYIKDHLVVSYGLMYYAIRHNSVALFKYCIKDSSLKFSRSLIMMMIIWCKNKQAYDYWIRKYPKIFHNVRLGFHGIYENEVCNFFTPIGYEIPQIWKEQFEWVPDPHVIVKKPFDIKEIENKGFDEKRQVWISPTLFMGRDGFKTLFSYGACWYDNRHYIALLYHYKDYPESDIYKWGFSKITDKTDLGKCEAYHFFIDIIENGTRDLFRPGRRNHRLTWWKHIKETKFSFKKNELWACVYDFEQHQKRVFI